MKEIWVKLTNHPYFQLITGFISAFKAPVRQTVSGLKRECQSGYVSQYLWESFHEKKVPWYLFVQLTTQPIKLCCTSICLDSSGSKVCNRRSWENEANLRVNYLCLPNQCSCSVLMKSISWVSNYKDSPVWYWNEIRTQIWWIWFILIFIIRWSKFKIAYCFSMKTIQA